MYVRARMHVISPSKIYPSETFPVETMLLGQNEGHKANNTKILTHIYHSAQSSEDIAPICFFY